MVVLSVFVAGIAHARVLHVGDNTIKLSQTKTTTPALHVRIGDELWYGNMVHCQLPMNESTDKELKIKYNDKIYNVIVPFTDITNYTYDENGQLTDANSDIYLESTGAQKIITDILPSLTLKVQISIKMHEYNGNIIFGTAEKTDIQTYRLFNYKGQIYFDINGIKNRIIGVSKSFDIGKRYEFLLGNRYVEDVNSDYVIQKTPLTSLNFTPDESHFLGVFGDQNTASPYMSKGKIFYLKIYDNDVLVRHFVPVPCGLKIGDFVVPSNGMWDIVEQKFYGNMGTGDFIYGVDE